MLKSAYVFLHKNLGGTTENCASSLSCDRGEAFCFSKNQVKWNLANLVPIRKNFCPLNAYRRSKALSLAKTTIPKDENFCKYRAMVASFTSARIGKV